ncbi:hypothetical protein [Sphingobacterium gobiense]|uniref:hypothetical protein n=1 Tax=Sphingobacterium gobiense TaxID=1382456 RepID=UPI001FE5D3E6|nr:hypothetical protein [Sphingobacterium gobiense]
MHKLSNTYRIFIAWSLSVWMVAIITSGVVFMHKEVTSTGEIVTHIHPYDFTKKGHPDHHHHSDDEIHFLDVVFAGVFVANDLQAFELAIAPIKLCIHYAELTENAPSTPLIHYDLRGPPALLLS